MEIYYEYLMDSPGHFIALKRWIEKDKPKYKEYRLSFNRKGWYCDCKGFSVYKKCKHMKFIQEEIKRPNMGIIRQMSKFDWYKELGYKGGENE